VVDGGGLENVSGSVIPRRLYFRGQLHFNMRKMSPDFAMFLIFRPTLITDHANVTRKSLI
jgi:hypothetical protein